MRLPFFRTHDAEAELFAEALALVEDGLEPDFVLSLYPNEASWLRPLLDAAVDLQARAKAEEPSLYFEASLKRRLLDAQEERMASRESRLAPLRAAAAGLAVSGAAAVVGVALVGWVTAEEAVPGDWNYVFKVANERIEYSLSRGDDRLDVKIEATYARLREVERLAERGELSAADLERVEREASDLQQLIKTKPLNERHREELVELVERANAVGERLTQEEPRLAPVVERTVRKVNDAVSAGLGKLEPVATPASTTPVPSAAAETPSVGSAEPSTTAAPAETPTLPAATPAPTVVPTEEATEVETPATLPPADATPVPAESSPSDGNETPTPVEDAAPDLGLDPTP